MASKTAAQNDPYDATKRRDDTVPSFVRIPTGDVEVDGDGELVLDEGGQPILKSQAFLVRRTGTALKAILKDETLLKAKHDAQQLEEDEAFKVEDEGGEKVDLDWFGARQEARASELIDLTYMSLSRVLCSPADGSHPAPEDLSNTLDYMTAAEWMRAIVPPMEQVPDTPDPETGAERTKPQSPTTGGSETDPGATS